MTSAADIARAFAAKLALGLAAAAPLAVPVHASGVPERRADFLEWLGLDPSPVVAAICDASQGRAVHLDADLARSTFGCPAAELPPLARRTVIVRAGGRGGKTSRLLAPMAIHAALTVALPTLAPGEHARAVIVAPDLDLAGQALGYVRGYLAAEPKLRAMVVEAGPRRRGDDEAVGTAERVTIRRPHDGKLVDIRIGAATRGGKAVRGKTLVFVGLDEAAFFYAEGGYAVTDSEIFRAATQRVVPGGQVWLVSTPWIEGYGVLEERLAKDFGVHGDSLCAVGPTRALNPTWDPDGEIERDMRATDPDNAAREIDAVPLPAGTKLFFPHESIAACVDKARVGAAEHVPPNGREHVAGTDLGYRKNSATLAIAREEERDAKPIVRIVYLEEHRPAKGEPLRPSVVIKGFAKACARYNASTLAGDLHQVDSTEDFLDQAQAEWRASGNFDAVPTYVELEQTQSAIADRYTSLRAALAEGDVELPNNARLLAQMRMVASKPTPGGGTSIVLPKVAGAHGDLLVAVVNAYVQAKNDSGSFASQMQKVRDAAGL